MLLVATVMGIGAYTLSFLYDTVRSFVAHFLGSWSWFAWVVVVS
jgi:hypothetical protein